MGKGLEQVFLKKISISRKLEYEKMFKFISHQGNAHQNCNEILFHVYQDDYNLKKKKIRNVSEDMESPCIAGGNVQ